MISIIASAKIKVDGVVDISGSMYPEKPLQPELTEKQFEEIRSVGFTTRVIKRSVGNIPFVITESFVLEMKMANPLIAALDVHCPVLVVHGTADQIVPVTDSEDLIGVLYRKDLLLIGGADHNFTNPQHLDSLIAGIIEWLEKF